jgi:hypothetical protein
MAIFAKGGQPRKCPTFCPNTSPVGEPGFRLGIWGISLSVRSGQEVECLAMARSDHREVPAVDGRNCCDL